MPDVSGVIGFGFCQVADSAEVQGIYATFKSEYLDALKNICDFSFVTFSWDEGGDCTRIGISTQSFYIPSQTKKDKCDHEDIENTGE